MAIMAGRGCQRRAARHLTFSTVLFILFPLCAISFQHGYVAKHFATGVRRCAQLPSHAKGGDDVYYDEPNDNDESQKTSSLNRRHFLEFASTATLLGGIEPSIADDEANLDCLLDLPPVSNDCVRIYLCRHGQTENNRLRLVQGARVDPPLNKYGEIMAERLGMAFARLGEENCPRIVMHSNMLRATQTAKIASEELRNQARLEPLASLGEVDFGPLAEGKKVAQVRADMVRTYGAWAAGFVDARPEGGGESGREVRCRFHKWLRLLLFFCGSYLLIL